MFGSNATFVIVFIDRNRLQFYGGNLSSILALDMPPTMVKDLEILNRDALYSLVNQWLKQNNLGGAQLFFVLSGTTYFDAVIKATGDSEQETEILKFYDTVPFEELTTKVFGTDNKKRAVATNREFSEAIRHAFTLQGYRVVGMVPSIVLGTLAAKRWLDKETGVYVVKHLDELVLYNMLEVDSTPSASQALQQQAPQGGKNNSRLLMLVGIFGILLLILIIVVLIPRS